MAENKMAEVARLLGVELDEEFRLTNNIGNNVSYSNCVLKINVKEGLMYYIKEYDFWQPCNGSLLNDILAGKYGIKKQPWKPKDGELYWTYFNNNWFVDRNTYSDEPMHHMREKCGAVFRTKEEAIKARPRVYEELTGREWVENG